jgi:hypothetical protein
LHIRAASLALKRPGDLRSVPDRLVVNVVQVFEPTPPRGEEPITWTLMTTEPIETPEQRAGVVDAYRARWRIEEYFKALKTGCAYEKRQLESEHALLNTLALLVPIAWRLLVLRNVATNAPETSAKRLLTVEELKLLRVISKRVVLPEEPTAREVLMAIAGLGGHLRRNGDPGWQVLGRGYEVLAIAHAGWIAAKARSDQS